MAIEGITIEGITVGEVVDYFTAEKYSPLHGKARCAGRDGFHWQFTGGERQISVVDIDSHTGEGDFTGVRLQISGATKDGAGGRPESISAKIDSVVQQSQIACVDAAKKEAFAALVRDRLKQAVYSTTGERQPNGAIHNESIAIFAGLRIWVYGALRDNGLAEATVDLRSARHRLWSDKSGKFQTTAAYLAQNATQVVLVTEDDRELKVPLARLSDEDRKLLARLKAEEDDREKRQREYAAKQAKGR
jgi:hypothetical protein